MRGKKEAVQSEGKKAEKHTREGYSPGAEAH